MPRGWREFNVLYITFLLAGAAMFGFLIPGSFAERTFPGVQGTVTDGSGSPLENVGVRIGTMDHSYFNGTWTNGTGYYLVNVSAPGHYRMGFVMDGYFEYAFPIMLPENQVYTVDVAMNRMPPETERVEGTLEHPNGAPAVGYRVELLYEEGRDRYVYEAWTDPSGRFGWNVFPGDFDLNVYKEGLALISEEVRVEQGSGTLTYDLVLPDLPPKDAVIKGYVKDDSGPVKDAMVGMMDSVNEIFNVTMSNETGYFELGFWAGFHYLISFTQGYEGYFRGLDVRGASTTWANITLMEEEFTISGTVRGPDGSPVEGIAVQYLQRFVFPETNSDKTDGSGHFSIDITGGDGYLLVVEDNPFETGEFDVYFKEYLNVSDNIVASIDLTSGDRMIGTLNVDLSSWSAFSSESRMQLPVNNSKAGRAMVDLMMGDGDLVISEGEAQMWKDIITGEGSEMREGPFGNITDRNFTIDNAAFVLDEDSVELDFINVTGPIASENPFELRQSSSYTLEGEVGPGVMHEISFNFTYGEGNEEMGMHLKVPDGWRHTGTSQTNLDIISFVNRLELIGAEDPDPEDDIDHEWVTLTFHDDTFEVVIDPVEPASEGEEVNFTANLTDHLPENVHEFTWTIDGTVEGQGDESFLTYAFPDNGTYDIAVDVNDSRGRHTRYEMTYDVGNSPPRVHLEYLGMSNARLLRLGIVLDPADLRKRAELLARLGEASRH
ncbi:MAG: carboxypeptidase regulatory-like domain-containing protein, partial [Thermoplasmatota archaeon]